MSSRKSIDRKIVEFNKKTFREKEKRRREQAKLPFEEKLKIVEELNALVSDFAQRRSKKKMKKPI